MQRFQVRFNNGTYHAFDAHQYRVLRSFDTAKAAYAWERVSNEPRR